MLRSERDDIILRMPLNEWVQSRSYSIKMRAEGGFISVQRFTDEIANDNDEVIAKVIVLEE